MSGTQEARTIRRISQHQDETAMEHLRRAVEWLNHEPESLLDDLPSVDAILDYFDLWTIYDTDFLQGVEEAISEGADPAPLLAFIKKYRLDRLDWDIEAIQRLHREAAHAEETQ